MRPWLPHKKVNTKYHELKLSFIQISRYEINKSIKKIIYKKAIKWIKTEFDIKIK